MAKMPDRWLQGRCHALEREHPEWPYSEYLRTAIDQWRTQEMLEERAFLEKEGRCPACKETHR